MKYEGKLVGDEVSPRPTRIDVDFDVLVRSAESAVVAQILNLSGKGFRLRANEKLPVGQEVTLEVARMAPVKAVIRWTAGLDCGGVFLDAVAL